MPRYAYSALTAEGAKSRGEVVALDEADALDRLAAGGLTVLDLEEGGQALPWWAREIGPAAGVLKPAELAHAFGTLATLLGAGFALPEALRFTAGDAPTARLRRVLERIEGAVTGGETLENAMATEGTAFAERHRALVALGERANKLPDLLSRAAAQIAAEAAVRREVRGALLYPAILVGMAVLVLLLLVFYLAPTLLPVFESTDRPAPFALRAMDGMRTLALERWPVLLTLALGVLAAALALRRAAGRVLSRLLLRAPVLGAWVRQRESARLAGTLRLLLEGGAAMDMALRAAAEATPHPAYARLLGEAEASVAAGGALAPALAAGGLVDDLVLSLARAGEEADSLVRTLAAAEATLSARAQARLAGLLKALPPVLTLVIGLGVAGLILSVIGAILDLNDATF